MHTSPLVLRSIFIFLVLFSSFFRSYGQNNLLEYEDFFVAQKGEFQQWLNSTDLASFLKVANLEIQAQKLVLLLEESTTDYDCKNLQHTWQAYQDSFALQSNQKLLLHHKLLDIWSVLTEVSSDSLEIHIRCSQPSPLSIKIIGKSDGRIVLQEDNLETMGSGTIPIKTDHLNPIYVGQSCGFRSASSSVRKVRLAISDYLNNVHYKDKGTPVFYNVRMDTTASYFNEFTFEYTHMSNVIAEGEVWEYHRIHVIVSENGAGDIEIDWVFTGKCGKGIAFPPKKNDYKLMETYYKEEMEAYEEMLFRLIHEHLLKQQ